MIGSFLTRGIIMLVGYLYPAYECFKAVEKNRADVQQLRFWCQYWIIIAIITVVERVADIIISWLPMYCEAKLAFIIYLWHPKTKGTSYIYSTFLEPLISSHEREIDKRLSEFRLMAGDMAYSYFNFSSAFIQSKVLEFMQYVTSQSSRPHQTQRPSQPIPSQYQQPPYAGTGREGPVSASYSTPLSSQYSQPSAPVTGYTDVLFSSSQKPPATGELHPGNPASHSEFSTAVPNPSLSPIAPNYPDLGSFPSHYPYPVAGYTAAAPTPDYTASAPSGFYPPLSGSYNRDLVQENVTGQEEAIGHNSANSQTEQRPTYPTVQQPENESLAAGYMTRSRRRANPYVHSSS